MKYALIDASLDTPAPKFATASSAGLDLVATSKNRVVRHYDPGKDRHVGGYVEYGTNLAVEIPKGFVGLLLPRSSSRDYSHILANSVGVIDADYRGEIKVSFRDDLTSAQPYRQEYQVGDIVAQLVIVPVFEDHLQLVDLAELSQTERADQGHGSTDTQPLPEATTSAPDEPTPVEEPVAPEPAEPVPTPALEPVPAGDATPEAQDGPDQLSESAAPNATDVAVAEQATDALTPPEPTVKDEAQN